MNEECSKCIYYHWESAPSHLIPSKKWILKNNKMRRVIERANKLLDNAKVFRLATRYSDDRLETRNYIITNQPGLIISETYRNKSPNCIFFHSPKIILHAISKKGLESIAKSLQLPEQKSISN